MPFFSIIIPCYNSQKTVKESLNSLEEQSYKDFEVICINDGSTDATEKIIEEYSEKSKMTIKYITQENQGVSIARNQGLRLACGTWILFLDSDDMLYYKCLELVVKSVENGGTDTAYFPLTYKRKELGNGVKKERAREENPEVYMKKTLYHMDVFGFCCYAYKLEILRQYNITFPELIKYGEDREFQWKYLVNCNKAIYIDKCMYWYRQTPNSAVHKTNWRRTDALISVQSTYVYLKKNNYCYAKEYYQYMYARNMLAVMFNFCRGKNILLYKELIFNYDVDRCMSIVCKYSPQRYSRVAATVYRINKWLFFYLISILYGKD